ncbi:methyl-accepting chemotaxis protein [Bacillus sp. FJAT-27264]|uniref:methyl-accepting chemotaxis protein n=1 Tax=Paenibacillus sp. (strain DSM 101736 / FJAT-27264) TaxID=1850362 RepID=UPI0015864D00|nr:methyl-accepting chemotaxis protein [Bacillus sp. FJAT-27264]
MVSFIVVVIVPSLIIGVMAAQSSRNHMRQQMLDSAQQSVETVNSIISHSIESKKSDVDFITRTLEGSTLQGPAAQKLVPMLEQYLGLNPDINNAYIGTAEGATIQGSGTERSSNDPREQDWYKSALAAPGQISLTPVVMDDKGSPEIIMSKAVANGAGVLGVSLNLDAIRTESSITIGKEGYVIVLDSNKKIVVHPQLKPAEQGGSSYTEQMFAGKSGSFEYLLDGRDKEMFFTTNELTGWKIGGTLYVSEMNEGAEAIKKTVNVTIAIILIIMITVSQFIVSTIIRPLNKLRAAAERISKGDLTENVDTRRQDEFGDVARSFQNMVDNLRAMIMGVQETTDLVSSSAEELTAGAEQTNQAIEQVSVAVQALCTGSERQVERVHKGAQSMEYMSEEIGTLSSRMQEVSVGMLQTSAAATDGNAAADQAVRQIHRVQETVERLEEVVFKLEERSLEIDTIVDVITGISRQTNLLALNASIEAARAGEQGRGFAVVASEVRKLAFNSEESASRISELVQAVRQHVEEVAVEMQNAKEKVSGGIEAVSLTGHSFAEITGTVAQSASTLGELAKAVEAMTHEVAGVTEHMEQIRSISEESAGITDSVSAATEEQLASTEEITSSSAGLGQMAEQLRLLVLRFKIHEDHQ